jgi:DNA gyrase subunit B
MEDSAAATAMFELLMGGEVAPRRDFIIDAATELDPSRIDT